ncbi:MAG TPA: hypothetical protein VFZ34_17230 [Blastocatellia bacterium]|nr:hypothetical protein [Blastocatellia bacterium]
MKILWRIWGALCLWIIILSLGDAIFLKIINESNYPLVFGIARVGFLLLCFVGSIITLYKINRSQPNRVSLAPEGYHFKTTVIVGIVFYSLLWSGWVYDRLRAFLQPLKYEVIISLVLVTVALALLGILLFLGTRYFPSYFLQRKSNTEMKEGI